MFHLPAWKKKDCLKKAEIGWAVQESNSNRLYFSGRNKIKLKKGIICPDSMFILMSSKFLSTKTRMDRLYDIYSMRTCLD